MPRGIKSKSTSKQKRQVSHIEDSAKTSGHSTKRAKQIAYATVSKQDRGGTSTRASSRRGGRRSRK